MKQILRFIDLLRIKSESVQNLSSTSKATQQAAKLKNKITLKKHPQRQTQWCQSSTTFKIPWTHGHSRRQLKKSDLRQI